MVMCYYYGLGVGHTYVHAQTSTRDSEMAREIDIPEGPDCDSPDIVESTPEVCERPGGDSQGADKCLPDVHVSDPTPDGDEYSEDGCSDGSCSGPSNDEEFYEMAMMYPS
jgi:hypothetical protein